MKKRLPVIVVLVGPKHVWQTLPQIMRKAIVSFFDNTPVVSTLLQQLHDHSRIACLESLNTSQICSARIAQQSVQ